MNNVALYLVYIDNIFESLSIFGGRMHSGCYNSSIYADDFIFLAPSVTEAAVKVCCVELESTNLKLNI